MIFSVCLALALFGVIVFETVKTVALIYYFGNLHTKFLTCLVSQKVVVL